MPIINRVADMAPEIAEWRRALHRKPELGFEVHETAAFVAAKLRAFGIDEVVEGIGRTGVVGLIRGRAEGGVIGLRADMDALPIEEASGVPYTSEVPGRMHACGHDGHTAMLLGAARYLAETRNFAGTVAVIFQPAEEQGGGGDAMVRDGLMERFAIEQVYGLHNAPGIPAGSFAIRPGGILASSDDFTIDIEGKGAHAAKPHQGIDTTLVAATLCQALQSVVARNVDPVASAVLSITTLRTGGDSFNVIPQTVHMKGTIRALDGEVRALAERRLRGIVEHIAAAFEARAVLDFDPGYPVTVNHADQTDFAAQVAEEVAGAGRVERDAPPVLGTEDFSYMLEARPGAFIFLGAGEGANLHHPAYDFNDEIIPVGVSYWVRLAETALPAG